MTPQRRTALFSVLAAHYAVGQSRARQRAQHDLYVREWMLRQLIPIPGRPWATKR